MCYLLQIERQNLPELVPCAPNSVADCGIEVPFLQAVRDAPEAVARVIIVMGGT